MTKKLPSEKQLKKVGKEFQAFKTALRNILIYIASGNRGESMIYYYTLRRLYVDLKPMFVKLERLHDDDAQFFSDFLVEWKKWRKTLS